MVNIVRECMRCIFTNLLEHFSFFRRYSGNGSSTVSTHDMVRPGRRGFRTIPPFFLHSVSLYRIHFLPLSISMREILNKHQLLPLIFIDCSLSVFFLRRDSFFFAFYFYFNIVFFETTFFGLFKYYYADAISTYISAYVFAPVVSEMAIVVQSILHSIKDLCACFVDFHSLTIKISSDG